jgi:hypothetical protein
VICLDGQISHLSIFCLSSPFCKNILIFRIPDSVYNRRHPVPYEGRFAIVTDVGCGMRWTRAVLQTSSTGADGEVVWSWHPVPVFKSAGHFLAGDGG